MNELPNKRPLYDTDITQFCMKYLNNFRGVFMRNELPSRCNKIECGVINLDDTNGDGTHWCAYHKIDNICFYFDSFGNLKPPLEFIKYMGSESKIFYNYKQYQYYNTYNCGHLCLQFLYEMSTFNNIIKT